MMTFAEIATELGISESQARRDEVCALAKLRAILDPNVFSMAEIALVVRATFDPNFFSTGNPSFFRVPRRFSGNPGEHHNHASRDAPPSWLSPAPVLRRLGVERRAELLFRKDTLMKKATTEMHLSKLEALALVHPEWPAAFTAANSANDADYAAASDQLFAYELPPVSGDAIQTYAFHIQRFAVGSYADEVAELHRRSLRTHPGVAALCRSVDAIADVERAAQVNIPAPAPAETWAEVGARARKRARRAYQVAIAAQIAAIDKHELHDVALALVQANERATKLDALKTAHDQHVAAEQARAEAEHAEAERIATEQRDQRELAEELASDLARLGPGASDAERHRVAAVVRLRRRLRVTRATGVRFAGRLYGTKTLGVDFMSLAECEQWTAALDATEASAS